MNPLLQVDIYKVSHEAFMPKGTTKIYSNFTARSNKHLNVNKARYDHKVVNFGLQHFIKDFIIKSFNEEFFAKPKEEVIGYFKRVMDAHLGKDSVDLTRFNSLHDLGYLPIEIKALPEGSLVDIKVPLLTITNTHPDYAWLTNYLETVLSQELWKPITIATIIREYRKLGNEYALKTTGSIAGTEFQFHDFSARGMSGRYDSAVNSAAFLLSSNGSDTVSAIEVLENSYNADVTQEFVGASVAASEHSVSCLGTSVDSEFESYKKWITEDYPTGIVSLVSDTYDYWRVLTEYLPKLKDLILARPVNEIGLSKVVIRPDSGTPADIICGVKHRWTTDENTTNGGKIYHRYEDGKWGEVISEAEAKGSVELLWETFGGTITEQGYKVLDSHIGLIYGDSITPAVALDVFQRLEAKGFASTNIVFGVGSYTMQYVTRDSLGMAVKATYAEVNGVGYELFKDPITDSGMKKSAKGLLKVTKDADGNFILHDQVSVEEEKTGELKTVFKDGELLIQTSLTEIRDRLWK